MSETVRERIQERIRDVKDVFSAARNLADDEMLLHWTKYACILISANLEMCLIDIFSSFTNVHSSSESVHYYVEWSLSRQGNPNRANIINLHKRFNTQWGKKIDEFIKEEEQRSAAITGIAINRNNIAHGRDCSINIHQLREWFAQIEEVIAFSHKLVLETGEEARAPRGGEGSGDV